MELEGKRVLVVGLARTGVATVRFLRRKGARVSATERRPRQELEETAREMEEAKVAVEWGGHRTETFLSQDLIVVSPGVDLAIPPIQEAVRKGVRVVSELELAYHYVSTPLVGVTGTNGKTTTTFLLGEMLKEAGKEVGVGGNVGEPLILFADSSKRLDLVVVEISSFQLEGIEAFRPSLALLLNVTEDHLDRYPCYGDYIEAKARIFMNQTSEDRAVLNRDDPIVMGLSERVMAKRTFFSTQERLTEGAFSDGERIFLRMEGKEESYSLSKAPLKGAHNVENMTAAAVSARSVGAEPEAVQKALDRFQGLEHRLEFVRELRGVRFYNDSKGTNVGSVVKSLESFREPIILIAGGKDKKGDLSPLKGLIRERVKRLILIGEARERMTRELGGMTDTEKAETLEEAVGMAFRSGEPGDVVLLSPACSSFDMFKDYKERGRVFKEAVRRLEP